ncbi:hypothetical protein BN1723_006096 [Verticillium longisporum]|uniref:Sec1-like protein n=1 Tax=Verticillium longisporum TaxID=100787 RepID=A0A0G4ND30_VERLO|nr:hypothetical protein BN1723_006096 [Verticillium longisporum]
MASKGTSLRDRQIASLKKILNLNDAIDTTETDESHLRPAPPGKIIESIMDPSTASSTAIAKTENYLYFDPRSANARGTMPPPSSVRAGGTGSALPGGLPGQGGPGGPGAGTGASFGQRRQGFSEAIVFTVGGGSMDEYGNLQEWVARTGGDRARKRVVYGSTDLLNAQAFLEQELNTLGREVAS